MSLLPYSMSLANCSSLAISLPTVFGAKLLSLEAYPVRNYSKSVSIESNFNHDSLEVTNISVCNVTVTHTHPGQGDTLTTQIWLPVQPQWNERMQAIGGGGWLAGASEYQEPGMAAAVFDGYAAITTDGGVPGDGMSTPWALLSPGNVNLYALQNVASVSLNDAALIGKSVIQSFYGKRPTFSYFSGCSHGGRQGLMLAQRYPTAFDGIAASAPGVNWPNFFVANWFPQQVMNEMKQYPHPCELEALTKAAIKACDPNDGLTDGLISDPDSCHFNPQTLVGTGLNCSATGGPKAISEAAAAVANAAWTGARSSNGSMLWYTLGYEADLTTMMSIASTMCSEGGMCMPGEHNSLFSSWIQQFVKKDEHFDLSSMSRSDYERVFRASVREYESIIGSNFADLSEFRESGGKIITVHGLADETVPYQNTRHYYDAVTALDPEVHDFYRLFESPGLAHCAPGAGAYPAGTFKALVEWVEHGVAPRTLLGKFQRSPQANQTNQQPNETRILCPYPQRARYLGGGSVRFACS
ncbi:tannase and feruloyl esterase [Eremomyces bilateralis CBS 781.70]|uniref:Carboxylic ester hydrolase n=1 Tax=Eremomyces bilateralis CBS 781.70 TaxID=1392243 RepID=A0A6G1GHU9_9PEZI|nr:tannase and feruloyl esterase [Eremomyces bilateralis CBS 781.70]KAF1817677.1 tannase and feruloyl esterase [Eremomyces bilateralis CBS 781.70]